MIGDPTEAALLVAAEKAGMEVADLASATSRGVGEVPFDSQAKRMVTLHRTDGRHARGLRQGLAGDAARHERRPVPCRRGVMPLTAEDRQRYLRWNRELAGAALRVLGLAYRELARGPRPVRTSTAA